MPDKFYRPALLILLLALLALQVYQLIPRPAPVASIPQDCVTAAAALDAALLRDAPAYTEYERAAYTVADNINQQIFIANEYIYRTLIGTAELQQALVKWQIACGG